MVERICVEIDDAAERTSFFIVSAEHHPRYACVYYRTGTHRTRLKRNVKRASRQPPPAETAAGFLNCDDLRVVKSALPVFPSVSRACDHFAVAHYHAPDRDLSELSRVFRLAQRYRHVFFNCFFNSRGNLRSYVIRCDLVLHVYVFLSARIPAETHPMRRKSPPSSR